MDQIHIIVYATMHYAVGEFLDKGTAIAICKHVLSLGGGSGCLAGALLERNSTRSQASVLAAAAWVFSSKPRSQVDACLA